MVRFYNRRWWRTLPNYYFFFALHIVFYYVFSIQENIDWRGLLCRTSTVHLRASSGVVEPGGGGGSIWSFPLSGGCSIKRGKAQNWEPISHLYSCACSCLPGSTRPGSLPATAYPRVLPAPIAGNYLEIYVRLPVVFRFSSILWGYCSHRFHVQKKMVR